MFQVTVDCKTFDLPILEKWLDHFSKIGIPAGIVKRVFPNKSPDKRVSYSVWRGGKEQTGDERKIFVNSKFPANAIVVKSVNGFMSGEKR